jgi:hypothetical protein
MSNGVLALLSFNVVTTFVLHSGATALWLAILKGRFLSSKDDTDFLLYFTLFERASHLHILLQHVSSRYFTDLSLKRPFHWSSLPDFIYVPIQLTISE